LNPSEVWRATPHEVLTWINGRTDRTYRVASWIVCHVVNCWSKRKIRPEQLYRGLGDKRVTLDEAGDPETLVEAVEEAREKAPG